MSSRIDAAIPLNILDPELQQLLAQRKVILDSLRDPIRRTQTTLSKLNAAGVVGLTPQNVDASLTQSLDQINLRVNNNLMVLSRIEQEISQLKSEQNNPSGQAELDAMINMEAHLDQLSKARMPDKELAKFAPKEFGRVNEVRKYIENSRSEIQILRRDLSSWWERVIVDYWFRDMFKKPMKRHRIVEAESELEGLMEQHEQRMALTQKQARVALKARQQTARQSTEKQRHEMAIANQKLDEALVNSQTRRDSLIAMLKLEGSRLRASLQGYCESGRDELNSNASRVEAHLARIPAAAVLPWESDTWTDWPLSGDNGKPRLKPFHSSYIRIGEVREKTSEVLKGVADGVALRWLSGIRSIRLPVVVPFIGGGKTLVVTCDAQTRTAGLELVQNLILRVAVMLGRQAMFTLLDPIGHGQAFPLSRFLRTRSNADDINIDLRGVRQDIARINKEVLTGEAGLHELDPRRLASETFEVIAAAGFPGGFDRRSVETLFNFTSVGQRAGRYVILHHDRDQPLPREHPINNVANSFSLDPSRLFNAIPGFDFHADELPTAEWRQDLLERINNAGRIDHSLAWKDLVGLDPAEWWTKTSETEIATPIGLRGATDLAEVWFGERSGVTCAHGMMAGMPGSGKSTLYHGLILGLAVRYHPDELRMYLVDGKFGVEFQPYEVLPHAAVVSLKSPPELSRSVLQELFREMERRNALFIEAKVDNLTRYRRATKEALPRVLLLIDEYQELFEDDPTGSASELLLRLSQQGRSAGIHMFLGAQKFGAPGMLNQAAIFGNIHLRMAMKMQPDVVAGLTEFGQVGKRLIRDIDVAGKFVLNATGQDDETISGQAANLEPELRPTLIGSLTTKADGLRKHPVVFQGDVAPSVFENAALQELLRRRHALTPKLLESQARKEEGPACGFGQPRWVAADRPIGLWLGRRFDVHGHAMAVVTRGIFQNLIVVGTSAEARAGMLAGLIVSASSQCRPEELTTQFLHAGGDDDDSSLLLLSLYVEKLLKPAGFMASLNRGPNQIESLLAELDTDLSRRKELGTKDMPSRLVVLVEPDRLPMLRRAPNAISRVANPHYETLHRLLIEGSQNGIHLVMVTSALSLLYQVIDKRQDLVCFSHRVGLQMSQNDSFELFQNPKSASSLQVEGSPLACALYCNVETNSMVRFKPYSCSLDGVEIDQIVENFLKSVPVIKSSKV